MIPYLLLGELPMHSTAYFLTYSTSINITFINIVVEVVVVWLSGVGGVVVEWWWWWWYDGDGGMVMVV